MTLKSQPVRVISDFNAFAAAFSVSRETVERLQLYESLLQQWQKTINLVAPGTLDQIWHRHFADSAQIVRLAPQAPPTWVDLGSGAGFPGLVVAIMMSEQHGSASASGQASAQTKVTLIESDSRKAAFLREAARQIGVPVDIVPTRIEAAATRASLKAVDVVSARALAPLTRLIGLALPFTGPNTVCLFPKGREALRELQAAETEWSFSSELVPSMTEPEARIAVLRNCRPRI